LRYMAAESTINAPSGSRYMAGAHWGIDDLKAATSVFAYSQNRQEISLFFFVFDRCCLRVCLDIFISSQTSALENPFANSVKICFSVFVRW